MSSAYPIKEMNGNRADLSVKNGDGSQRDCQQRVERERGHENSQPHGHLSAEAGWASEL